MVLYGNTAKGLAKREEWFAIPAERRAGGGCNSAGLSHALGASSVSCLVLESLLYLEQTVCLQPQILQHMHYSMPSPGVYVVLRFTAGPWVPGELYPNLPGLTGQAQHPALASRARSLVLGARQMQKKNKERSGEMLLFRCDKSISPIHL